MTFSKRMVGASALVICMMVLAFVPMLEDTDVAGTQASDFASDFNAFAKDVVGEDAVTGANAAIWANGDAGSLNIVVDTNSEKLETIVLNLEGLYAKFSDNFKGYTVKVYDNYGPGGTARSTITIIDNGELVKDNIMDLGIRVLQQVKDAIIAGGDDGDYSGTIIINGEEFDLKFHMIIAPELKSIVNTVLSSHTLQFGATYDAQGKFSSLGVTVNMDQKLYDVIGLDLDGFKDATVATIVSKFAVDNVLPTLVDNTNDRAYINIICSKINNANGLANLLKDNLKIVVGEEQISFTSPTISTKAGFQGLMETLYDSMKSNFNKQVKDYVDSTNVGVMVFKQVGVKILTGQGQGVFGMLKVNPTVSYGGTYITMTAETVEGATITIDPSTNLLPGKVIKLSIALANPSYAIASVVYKIDNVEKETLQPVAEQNVTVLFGEGAHSIAVTLNQATYTVTWMSGDTVLEIDQNVAYGTTPEYNGDTPTKAETDKYTYTFAGWDPEISPVVGDVTYKAVFTEITKPVPKETEVEFISDSNEKTVTAKISDIKDSQKETVVIGKAVEGTTETQKNWTVEIAADYFEDKAADTTVAIVLLDLSGTAPTDIPEKQMEKIEGMTLISIDMTVGLEKISKIGQKVTVRFAYTPKEGENTDRIAVYYVNTDSEKLERYDATYADGYVTFETDHFSYWAVGEELIPEFMNDNLLLAILLIAAIILPIIAALIIFKKE